VTFVLAFIGDHSRNYDKFLVRRLRRQSLQCSWTSSLELAASGRQTAGLALEPLQMFLFDRWWCFPESETGANPDEQLRSAKELHREQATTSDVR